MNLSFRLTTQKCMKLQKSLCIFCSVAKRWEGHKTVFTSVTLHYVRVPVGAAAVCSLQEAGE